jgi:hypothetical protein
MQENEFAWDCNQTWVCYEPQSETGEDLLAREKALDCDPEICNTAHRGSTGKQ